MAPIDPREGRRPLYQRIADELAIEIQEGVHRVGSLLPSEAELCVRFGVSRQTVREALRSLAELGLVSRHHGVGSLVESDRLQEQYVQRLGSLPDLSQYVKETRRKVLRVTDLPASAAEIRLPGDPRARWRMLEGLRFVASDRRPIAWTRIFIRAPYASVTGARDRDEHPLHALIERAHGVKARTVRQEIAGVAIAPEVSALLRVRAGSVGLAVRREYVSTDEEIFEVSISVHPADRYRYRMQLDLDYSAAPAAASSSRKRG